MTVLTSAFRFEAREQLFYHLFQSNCFSSLSEYGGGSRIPVQTFRAIQELNVGKWYQVKILPG